MFLSNSCPLVTFLDTTKASIGCCVLIELATWLLPVPWTKLNEGALGTDVDEVWNDYVKTGKVQGFSIDAMLSLEEVKLSKNQTTTGIDIWFKDSMITEGTNVQTLNGEDLKDGTYELMTEVIIEVVNGKVINLKSNIEMSNTNTLLERILLALTPTKQAEVKFGSMMLADGSVKIEFEGEEMKVGDAIWVVAEDGTKVPVPVGEHPLEDGTILVVAVEGVVGEIKPASEPAGEPAPAQDMGNEDGKVSNDAKIASEIESAIKSILIKYTAQETKIAELENQITELSKQPASKPINGTPVQIDFSKMTAKERILNTINKNKN